MAKEGVATKDFYQGSQESIVRALYEIIDKPSFIHYSEDSNSKLNKHKIFGHGALVRALAPLQPNLAFARRKLELSLEAIAIQRSFFAPDDKRTLREWSSVCTARLRVLLRHFRQAVLKSRGCRSSWVRLVLSEARIDQACLPLIVGQQESLSMFSQQE